jgi:hypothetical protein
LMFMASDMLAPLARSGPASAFTRKAAPETAPTLPRMLNPMIHISFRVLRLSFKRDRAGARPGVSAFYPHSESALL